MKQYFKIGSVISLVGLVAFLIIWIYSLKADKASLEWDLAARDAEIDTIFVQAEYSLPETVWSARIRIVYDTLTGHIDTVLGQFPEVSGSIKVDTTKELGPPSNLVSIRVVGELWYPERYSNRNWMLIHPIIGEKVSITSVTRSQKSVGLGLNYLRSFNQHDYFGASVRYKRLTVTSGYDFWKRSLIVGLNYEIWGF